MIKIRFLIVGLWNTFFALSTLYLLLELFDNTNYRLILIISFLLANLQSHLMQRLFVWKSRDPYFMEIFRFLCGAVGISLLNFLLLAFLVEELGFPIFETQVVIALSITTVNFLFQKYFVFNPAKK